jgi:O-antigen ligase
MAGQPSRAVITARALLMALVVGIMYSPPLTVALEIALAVMFIGSAELRSRFAAVCRQPMVIGLFAFYLMLAIAVTYSVTPLLEAAAQLSGWRKLLLLPAAAAVFDDSSSKLRMALLMVIATTVSALISYGSIIPGIAFTKAGQFPGTIVRNHATQGMLFAVGAFTAAALALLIPLERRQRILLGAAAALLVSNIAFVTFGRSGYVVLVACAIALAWFAFARPGMRQRWTIVAMVVVAIGVLLASPKVHQRVDLAVKEMDGAVTELNDSSKKQEYASMGVRVHYWKNTLEMIQERPLLGVGTNGFEPAYRQHVAGRPGWAGSVIHDPHNQFMKIAAEQGLIGLAIFLAFLAATVFMQRPDSVYRLLGLGVLFAWCTTSLANSHFSTFSEGSFIFLWLGAMLSDPTATMRRKS